jgi:lipopolysaccharide transport system ATP-binding protein
MENDLPQVSGLSPHSSTQVSGLSPHSSTQVSGLSPQVSPPVSGLSPHPSDDVLIRVENVSKKFCRSLKKSLWYGMKDLGSELIGRSHEENDDLRPDEFWAVKDVSFELKRGECLGLIGRNGAGKTTLLRMLNGLIKPDKGRIEMRGRVGALIALGAGFNPILTGRENIYVNASVLGLKKKEIDAKFDEIVDFAELGEFIDAPVQSYSSGMQVRLGFAVATALKPDILLLDEILAVGDTSFRSKCWRRIGNILSETAVILVSHEAYAISRICDRAILIDKGKIKCDSLPNEALEYYIETQPISPQKKQLLIHASVDSVSFSNISDHLISGEIFKFDMAINMKEKKTIDHAVININDQNDDVHAQCLLNFPSSGLAKGENLFHFSIGPLFLSKGFFTIMILISSSGGKLPLIQSKYELSFYFNGHVNFGPKYYPQGELILKTNNHR